MNFKTPQAVESTILQMVYAEWSRATNRAAINQLFNGFPPYSAEEQIQNGISVNVNDLTATNIAMSARGQFSNALVTPDPIANVEIDYGPVWKRREWGSKITAGWNKRMKGSLAWQEEEESTFANVVLHGIAPSMWIDKELWVPKPKLVEDVLVPARTYRSMENLQMFAVREQYTGMQLRMMTQGPNRDPGWNMPLVSRMIKWVDAETRSLMGNNWPETWQPEKWAERWKEDAGLFTGDDVPTVDVFHFYFWNDDKKVSGWNKRIILDTWGNPGMGSGTIPDEAGDKYGKDIGSGFLYDPGDKKYADELGHIAHWQFGDASAVAPFRYHSVRSLGFLLYAVCHLQNRLKCKFSEAAFESLMQYFRVTNPEDAERATKVDLVNRAVIPDGVNFMPQNERWQTQEALAARAMEMLQTDIAQHSSSFTQSPDLGKEDPNETATAVMAKVNAASQLIGAMLNRAYNYQTFKLQEVARRFCIPNSKDGDVRKFRLEMLKDGVPEEALCIERWQVTPVRVIGNGNKMLQVAMADKLMSQIDRFDPSSQQDILRQFAAVNSNDYDLAARLVPEIKDVSPTVNQAQNDAGTLLTGQTVTPRRGINLVEYIETLLYGMAIKVKQVESTGNVGTADDLLGLSNLGQMIGKQIQLLAKNRQPATKSLVKNYSDHLGQMMNLVKAMAQRQAEQKQQQQGNGADPKDAAKVQAMLIQAQTKSKIQSQTHAQRTAERQISFQQKIRENAENHKVEVAKKDLEAAGNIRRNRMKSLNNGE